MCPQQLIIPLTAELATLYRKYGRLMEAANTYSDAGLHKQASFALLDAKQYEMAMNELAQVADVDMTEEDQVTLFLLRLYLVDLNRFQFSMPVIKARSGDTNSFIYDFNVMLESLYILLSTPTPDEDDPIAFNNLIHGLGPRLNARQIDILLLAATRKH